MVSITVIAAAALTRMSARDKGKPETPKAESPKPVVEKEQWNHAYAADHDEMYIDFLKTMYETATSSYQKHLDLLEKSTDRLESLIQWNGIVLSILFTSLITLLTTEKNITFDYREPYILYASLGLLLTSLAIDVFSLNTAKRVLKFFRPNILLMDEMFKEKGGGGYPEVMKKVSRVFEALTSEAIQTNSHMVKFTNAGQIAFFFGLVFAASFLIVQIPKIFR